MSINEQKNMGFFMVDDYIDDVLENYFSLNQIINTIGHYYQPSNINNLDPRYLILAIGSLADKKDNSQEIYNISFDSIKEEIKIIENTNK